MIRSSIIRGPVYTRRTSLSSSREIWICTYLPSVAPYCVRHSYEPLHSYVTTVCARLPTSRRCLISCTNPNSLILFPHTHTFDNQKKKKIIHGHILFCCPLSFTLYNTFNRLFAEPNDEAEESKRGGEWAGLAKALVAETISDTGNPSKLLTESVRIEFLPFV